MNIDNKIQDIVNVLEADIRDDWKKEIAERKINEIIENTMKGAIGNFHCSEHGEQTPLPQCPECDISGPERIVYTVPTGSVECECGKSLTIDEFYEWEDSRNIIEQIKKDEEEGRQLNERTIRLAICRCGRIYLRKIDFFEHKHRTKIRNRYEQIP